MAVLEFKEERDRGVSEPELWVSALLDASLVGVAVLDSHGACPDTCVPSLAANVPLATNTHELFLKSVSANVVPVVSFQSTEAVGERPKLVPTPATELLLLSRNGLQVVKGPASSAPVLEDDSIFSFKDLRTTGTTTMEYSKDGRLLAVATSEGFKIFDASR